MVCSSWSKFFSLSVTLFEGLWSLRKQTEVIKVVPLFKNGRKNMVHPYILMTQKILWLFLCQKQINYISMYMYTINFYCQTVRHGTTQSNNTVLCQNTDIIFPIKIKFCSYFYSILSKALSRLSVHWQEIISVTPSYL